MDVERAMSALLATGRYIEARMRDGERVVVHLEMAKRLEAEARLDEREAIVRAAAKRARR
jgi:phosphatidylserine decarboxylase